MINKIIIVGTTMFSAELQYILKQSGIDVIAFSVDERYMCCEKFCNLPVYPFEKLDEYVDMSETEVLLSLGYSHMNDYRRDKYIICKEKGYKIYTLCSSQAIVLTEKIGEGSIIMPGSYVGPYSKIGLCNVVRAGTVLSHHDIIGDYNWIADGCTFGGGVTMGDNCFVGLGSTIRNEINISDYSFVGAHSYVGHNTQSHSVNIGAPARVLKNHDSLDIINRV